MNYSCDDLICDEQPVCLGDWREIVGNGFSGSAIYKTRFTKPRAIGDKFTLDLGKVRHTCEVFLNGKSLGVRVFSPYRYELSSNILQDENTLEIRVSNLPANELHYTKSFEKFAQWQVSTYSNIGSEFDKDCLDGGLFGPVLLKY